MLKGNLLINTEEGKKRVKRKEKRVKEKRSKINREIEEDRKKI